MLIVLPLNRSNNDSPSSLSFIFDYVDRVKANNMIPAGSASEIERTFPIILDIHCRNFATDIIIQACF